MLISSRVIIKLFVLFIYLNGFSVNAQCDHIIRLTDTYGDGWINPGTDPAATIDVYLDGVLIHDEITLASGSGPQDFIVTASTGQTIYVEESIGGTWSGECRVEILSPATGSLLGPFDPSVSGHSVSADCGTPMAFDSYISFQASTADVEVGSTDQVLIGIEIITTGSLFPIDLTSIDFNLGNGAPGTAPTDYTGSMKVYYTGSSSVFNTTTLFDSQPLGGTQYTWRTFTGTQTLLSGSNFFWLAIDLSTSAVIGNIVDGRCRNAVIDGLTEITTVANPAGSRTIVASVPTPGAVGKANLTAWFRANDLANGDVSAWTTNYPTGASALTAVEAGAPYPQATDIPTNNISNYNRTIDFLSNTWANLEGLAITTATDLIDNSASGEEGTFFASYYLPSADLNGHLLSYNEIGQGDGIQFRNLNATGRVAIGRQGDNTRACRDYTETFRPTVITSQGNRSGLSTMYAAKNSDVFTGGVASQSTGFDGVYFGYKPDENTSAYNGYLHEFIFFDRDLTSNELLRVESYLAIKYGATLVGDYLSSSGTLIWDQSVNTQYHNNVIGIGRDDGQDLFQKQSHSFFDTTRIYLGTLAATNYANTGNFTNDDSFIVAGDDQGYMCLTPASMAEMPASCGLYSRIEREWKVTRTKMADDFSMDVKLAACAQPGMVNISHLRFLVDDDGDFSNGGTTCYYNGDGTGISITYNNPVITVSGINTTHIPDNQIRYVTIGSTNIQTPLPVELSDFAVKCVNGQAYIQWETASEYNNDFFTVERSRDNVNFDLIHVEQGSGSTSLVNVYSFIDQDMDPGTNYYRISQFDIDGSKEVLFTRALNCEVSSDVKLYPNPFGDQITITTQQEGQVVLMDIAGKIVGIQTLSPGENILNTSGLAQAAYIARVILDNEDSKEFKLIKL